MRAETDRYALQNGLPAATSTAPIGSSLHDQQVAKLTRRQLVLRFPAGPRWPGVVQEVTYDRLKQ